MCVCAKRAIIRAKLAIVKKQNKHFISELCTYCRPGITAPAPPLVTVWGLCMSARVHHRTSARMPFEGVGGRYFLPFGGVSYVYSLYSGKYESANAIFNLFFSCA